MKVSEQAQKICNALEEIFTKVDEAELEHLLRELKKARHIFTLGKGRSSLVMRMFAMRLMHLGFSAYVVDETVTPSIGKDDLLLIGSGSGKTATCLLLAQLAKKAGASVGLITTNQECAISLIVDFSILLPIGAAVNTKVVTQFGGSYFEQTLLICLDAAVSKLGEQSEAAFELMQSRHSNLE